MFMCCTVELIKAVVYCQRCMALEVPQFSVDARVFMEVSYLETLNFVLYHLSDVKSWHVKLNQNMDYYSYFCQKVLVLFCVFVFNTDTQVVTSGECGKLVNQTKEIWRDLTRFAIISKPKIQITQNKNPVEANYIAYHIIVNFFKTDIQLSQKKMLF